MTEPYRLLGVEELHSLPDPTWLIDGVVPESGLSAIFGGPGTGKSFLALDWALCVAAGVPWLGHDVEQGHVVYVAAEGRSGLKVRVAAWRQARPDADLSRIRFLPEAVSLIDPRQVDRARTTLATLPEPPVLIVGDTLARLMPGGDENSAKDVGLLVQAIDELRGTGAGLLVHHSGLDGERERGSTALRGAVDLLAQVKRESTAPRLTVRCEKAKDAAPFRPIDLSLDVTGASCTLSLAIEPETSVGEATDLQERVLAFVTGNAPAPKRAIRSAITVQRASRVDDALTALATRGLVIRSSKGWEACPGASDTLGHAEQQAQLGGVSHDGEERRSLSPAGHASSQDVSDKRDTVPSAYDPASAFA